MRGKRKLKIIDFKDMVENRNLLRLIDNLYRTRLANDTFKRLEIKIIDAINWDDYESTMCIFKKCNSGKNAFSFGTKVLHLYNPYDNPILDSVVRKSLGILHGRFNINLCVAFRKAMIKFANENKQFFILENYPKICTELKKQGLSTEFPRMKILDMVLYQRPNQT